ncbi:hypothetical protein JZU71_05170, partial [bacterium]|nr:hypothetical protein [bacterium]
MEGVQNRLGGLPVSEDRRFSKKLAAGRTYLSIALLMADLESQYGNGYYGQRVGWYLSLADNALQQALNMNICSEEIIRD